MTSAASAPVDHGPIVAALSRRLAAVAAVVLGAPDHAAALDGVPDEPAALASVLIDALVVSVQASGLVSELWLLLTAVGGAYPTIEEVEEGRRRFELDGADRCTTWLLETAASSTTAQAAARDLELLSGVVVDVRDSATIDLHTGIQQVVRSVMPRWVRAHDLALVGWWSDETGLRRLSSDETARVVSWGLDRTTGGVAPDLSAVLVVPWQAVVVLPDTASSAERARLACVARFSGSRVVGIGYDCIPAVSADLVPIGSAGAFARYLQLVKHMHRVAAISSTSADAFLGFVSALPTQGLTGPVVTTCLLGTEETVSVAPPVGSARPQIACIGSYEPRKNHLGLLHAAEVLWREGLDFQLVLVGGMAWTTEIPLRIEELRAAGRPLEALHAVDQDVLDAVYAASRFTVFPSLHEGYGLPVVESLAHGRPVITSAYGSTAEVAAGGGALLVDPRDDRALAAAMRRLLVDDALLQQLQDEIARRPIRTWDDYATDLWQQLVVPEAGS